MDLQRIFTILLRRWWLVFGMPALVLAIALVLLSTSPYVASLRASVLIPGDTEATGNAERPELMVLDDLPELITSSVFANAVSAQLQQGPPEYALSVAEVQSSLSADRYSRILTVRATREDEQQARALIEAVRVVLPDQINSGLIPEGGEPATVRFLETAILERDSPTTQGVALIVQTLVALAIGCGLAALGAALDQRMYTPGDVRAVLDVPVLGDLRTNGNGRFQWMKRLFTRKQTTAPGSRSLLEPVRALRSLLDAASSERSTEHSERAYLLVGVDVSTAELAVCLGRSFETEGKRCLVILPGPSAVSLQRGDESPLDLTPWLTGGEVDLPSRLACGETRQAIVSPPAGGLDPMRSERWAQLLDGLQGQVDVILVSVRPLQESADALTIARQVGETVLAVATEETNASSAVQARAAILTAGGTVIGAVIVPAR